MPRYTQTRANDKCRRTMAKLLTEMRANNVEGFERTLDIDGLPSAANNMDFKLLKKALIYGRSRIAHILLDRGCRAHRRFDNGQSPLHLAVSKTNCIKVVRRLLDSGARVDQKNRNGDTPLHVAFSWAHTKVIDLLMEKHLTDSFANVSNRFGLTFLHIAATTSELGQVKNLIEYGNASVSCQIDLDSDSPYAGYTPLHMAVQFNRPDVARLLLDYNADLWAKDAHGSTPIHLALERRNINMIDILFLYDYKRENYVNDSGISHFMAACACTYSAAASDYLKNQVNSKTAMINERVDQLGENIHHPFKNYTPIQFAAEYGRRTTVQLLLENYASCLSRTTSDLLPERLAATSGFHDAASLFFKHDLQMRTSDIDNDSAIFSDMDTSDDDEIMMDDDLIFWEDDIGNFML